MFFCGLPVLTIPRFAFVGTIESSFNGALFIYRFLPMQIFAILCKHNHGHHERSTWEYDFDNKAAELVEYEP